MSSLSVITSSRSSASIDAFRRAIPSDRLALPFADRRRSAFERSSDPDASVLALGLRRESTRTLTRLDIAFLVVLAAVVLVPALRWAGLSAALPAADSALARPILGLAIAACAAWLAIRLPAWRALHRGRW